MKKIARIELLFLTIGVFTILQMGCSKKGDTEYYPLSDKCWHINNWTGLQPDSMLNIDTLLDIPTANQDYVAWLSKKENHVLIRSLITENYEDLKCMDQYFNGIRIVQLGESNHGTKEYNLIKVRLIKYLHEVHGFNVIAFESGFFDCAMANINAENSSIEETVTTSIFNVWQTEELVDLFYYMKYRTNLELKLAGFDCQDLNYNNNKYNRAQLLKEIASYIDPIYAERIYLNDIEVTYYMFNQNMLITNRDLYKAKVDSAVSFFEINYSSILDSLQGDETMLQIAVQSLKSTNAYIDKQYYYFIEDDRKGFEVRDSAMAANIVFLSEEMYPNEKIIIWAHNAHINYDLDNYTTIFWDGLRFMGNWLHEYYSNEIYTIGLYSLRGEFSWAGETFPLQMPTFQNSLEGICYQMNKTLLFFDITNHAPEPGNAWFDEIIYGRIGDDAFEELYLRKEYDGIVFIDKSSVPEYLY